MTEFLRRLTIDVLFVVIALFAPWWFVFALGVIAVLVFPFYAEIIFIAFIMDIAYGAFASVGPIPLLTIAAVVLFIVSVIMRRWLRFYGTDEAELK